MSLPEPDRAPESPPPLPDTPTVLPTPVLTGPTLPDASPRYTANDWLMFALGVLIGLASIITQGLATLVLLVLFFLKKPPRPPIWRGIGLGIILVGIAMLGALAVCMLTLGARSS